MSKLLIWVTGGKVESNYSPSPRFRIRLDKAVDVYREQKQSYDEVEFLISGRWANTTDEFLKTEARVGRYYILDKIPNAFIIEENISVEFIGNLAFSKQLLRNQYPTKVIAIFQELLKERAEYLMQKIFAKSSNLIEILYTRDELTDDPQNIIKQKNALTLCKNLLQEVKDGDDALVRDILLYQTPYYYRISEKQNKDYFDKYWPGGFEDYISARKQQLRN